MDLVGQQIGNYIARRELGRGGMGVVYLAEHPIIGRKVAVKVLHEELAINEQMVQRLWLEAKSASEIDSEHIVEVVDFGRLPLGTAAGEPRETVYLAMELLEGASLAEVFWSEGLTFRDAVDIGRQICRALEASHEKGIIHRDLKPENIFLINRGEGRGGRKRFVKVLDFGIAKLLSNPYTRTRTGVLLGTPAYMSPEQCRGSGEVDHRSDVYALGVMLYELTTGTLPFAAQGFGDVLVAQMTRKPEPPSTHNPNLPRSLEAIILCALEKRPEDRFQSMAALGAALGNVAAELERDHSEAQVRAAQHVDKTTEREGAAGLDGATVPDASSAETDKVVPRDLHAQPTQALGADAIHHRATVLKDGLRDGLHGQTTLLKDPSGQAATPTPAASPAAPARDVLNQRLKGVSLREVLGSTGAVRLLEDALDEKGAPPPVAPNLTPIRGTPVSALHTADELDDFVAAERRRVRRRAAIVGGLIALAMVAALLLLLTGCNSGPTSYR